MLHCRSNPRIAIRTQPSRERISNIFMRACHLVILEGGKQTKYVHRPRRRAYKKLEYTQYFVKYYFLQNFHPALISPKDGFMQKLQNLETVDSISAKLDIARRALSEVTEDWQRIEIRNYAKAMAAAAAILNRKEIQVQAAILVMDAERTIVKANSAQQGKRTDKQDFVIPNHEVVKPDNMRKMRQAHNKLTDAEYTAVMQEAIGIQIPPTRASLIKKGNEKSRAENNAAQQELLENPLELPAGEYRTLVVDPPWPMEKIKREVRPNQEGFDYPVMSIEQISSIALPLARDAFVFLWTTQKFLPHAFGVLESWGLTYRFTMVWHKNGGIQPYNSAQFNCEFILVGSIGNPMFADLKSFKTVFHAPRLGHSVKPEEFYEILDRVTQGPRLDMFSRHEIPGFDVWGTDIDSHV